MDSTPEIEMGFHSRKSRRIPQKKIEKFRSIAGNEEENLIEAVSGIICNEFRVSRDVIQKRIRKEKLKL